MSLSILRKIKAGSIMIFFKSLKMKKICFHHFGTYFFSRSKSAVTFDGKQLGNVSVTQNVGVDLNFYVWWQVRVLSVSNTINSTWTSKNIPSFTHK